MGFKKNMLYFYEHLLPSIRVVVANFNHHTGHTLFDPVNFISLLHCSRLVMMSMVDHLNV